VTNTRLVREVCTCKLFSLFSQSSIIPIHAFLLIISCIQQKFSKLKKHHKNGFPLFRSCDSLHEGKVIYPSNFELNSIFLPSQDFEFF
jgi:hypothetical protein